MTTLQRIKQYNFEEISFQSNISQILRGIKKNQIFKSSLQKKNKSSLQLLPHMDFHDMDLSIIH